MLVPHASSFMTIPATLLTTVLLYTYTSAPVRVTGTAIIFFAPVRRLEAHASWRRAKRARLWLAEHVELAHPSPAATVHRVSASSTCLPAGCFEINQAATCMAAQNPPLRFAQRCTRTDGASFARLTVPGPVSRPALGPLRRVGAWMLLQAMRCPLEKAYYCKIW